MRKLLKLVGIVVVLILIAVVVTEKLVVTEANKPIASVSDTFVKDMLSYQAAPSYKLFSTKAQSAYSYPSWQADTNTLSTFFDGQKASRSTVTADSNGGKTVDYTVKGSDGTYTISVKMVKQGDVWRVNSYESTLQTSK